MPQVAAPSPVQRRVERSRCVARSAFADDLRLRRTASLMTLRELAGGLPASFSERRGNARCAIEGPAGVGEHCGLLGGEAI
jgi:hypothetical protein